jgi:hypothetical protein
VTVLSAILTVTVIVAFSRQTTEQQRNSKVGSSLIRGLKEADINIQEKAKLTEQIASPPTEPNDQIYLAVQSIPNTELTFAIIKLLTLQCLTVNEVEFIEPTIQHDGIGTTIMPTKPDGVQSIPLSHIYNTDFIRNGMSPLDFKHIDVGKIGHVLIVDISSEYERDTSNNCMRDSSDYRENLHSISGLEVTHELCLHDNRSLDQTWKTVKDFASFMRSGSNHKHHKQTLILYRRLGGHTLRAGSCSIDRLPILPSNQIAHDTQKYITDSLAPTDAGTAMAGIFLSSDAAISTCFERLVTRYHSLKQTHNFTHTFLAAVNKPMHRSSTQHVKMLYRALYQRKHTPSSWNDIIKRSSSHPNISAYMDVLKGSIASQMDCLIMTSNDHMSQVVSKWHKISHPSRHRCTVTIKDCLV